MKPETVIIIGAGPAGLAAALQLKRYGVPALVLERAQVGGLLRNANLVENYPGFPEGIPGPALVNLLEEQARRAAIDIVFDEVVALTHQTGAFQVETAARMYRTHVVVVASGTKPSTFSDFPVPHGLRARVLYEIYPILAVAGQRIVIVGAGDAAFDYALNLGRLNDVIILNRGQAIQCLPLLRTRAATCSRIRYRERTHIRSLSESPGGRLQVQCESADAMWCIDADYVIGALGREPRLDFVSERLSAAAPDLESRGLLHFVGDVENGIFRQTAIAVGQGVLAAMKIHQRLKETCL